MTEIPRQSLVHSHGSRISRITSSVRCLCRSLMLPGKNLGQPAILVSFWPAPSLDLAGG
jgi:hypothetical protein